MELDEMKTAWKEVDERLGRQEMFSAAFIKESLAARSQRSANKFLNYEIAGVVAILLVLPLVLWVMGRSLPAMKIFLTVLLPLLPVIFVWQLIKTFTLWRIDMSGDMLRNARAVKRYELCVMGEKRVSYIFILLMFIGVGIVYAILHMPLWAWAFLAGIFIIGMLFCIWYYKKFYVNNMSAIKKGLEELKDL